MNRTKLAIAGLLIGIYCANWWADDRGEFVPLFPKDGVPSG
jgi:hypothetical protein